MTQTQTEILASQAIEAEDYIEAQRLLGTLESRDSEYTLMTLGWMHEVGKPKPIDLTLATSFYERAAKVGCSEAYNCLGRVFRTQGEFAKARKAYGTGAELGNLGSMCWLGAMMLWGQGGPADVEHGTKWLNSAAEKGHLAAIGQLLILEKKNSGSVFKYIKYYFNYILLSFRIFKEYKNNKYSDKIF